MLNFNEFQQPDEPTQLEFAPTSGDDGSGSGRKPRTAVGGGEFQDGDEPAKKNDDEAQVLGSILVGHDGVLLCTTMPDDSDLESMGAAAVNLFIRSEHVSEQLGLKRVSQIAFRTNSGCVLLKDIGCGIFVTVANGGSTSDLIELIEGDTPTKIPSATSSGTKEKAMVISMLECGLRHFLSLPAKLKRIGQADFSQ